MLIILQAVATVLMVIAGLVTSQDTLLAPLNNQNIALSQVIFLPPAPDGFSQPDGRIQYQYSSNEDEISSREDTMRSDLIEPAAPVPGYSEEQEHHAMSGSYAYVRKV